MQKGHQRESVTGVRPHEMLLRRFTEQGRIARRNLFALVELTPLELAHHRQQRRADARVRVRGRPNISVQLQRGPRKRLA